MATAISSRNALHAPDTQTARPAPALDFLVSNKPAREKTDRLADDMKQAMKALQSAGEQTDIKTSALADLAQVEERSNKDESAVTLIGFAIVVAAIFLALNLISLVI